MRLVVASLLIPFSLHARYRGTLTAHRFDLNSIGNQFGTGSVFSLKSLGSEQGRSSTTLGIHQRGPTLVNNPQIRNGIKKEGMLCLEGTLYTTRPPAYCSCY